MKVSSWKRNRRLITSFIVFTFIISYSSFMEENSSLKCFAKQKIKLEKLYPKLDKLPPPLLLKSGIGTNVTLPSNINDFGYAQSTNTFPSTVTFVDPRSSAWASGLQPGDKLLSASFDTRGATLIVERKDKKYLCQISAYKALTSDFNKEPQKENTKTLLKYEIVLLVDSSASMNTKDCPEGRSRWQWCREQALNLLEKDILSSKTTIILFSSNYSLHAHCRISDLPQVFANNSASGETFLAPPLKDALSTVSSQLYAGRPALIAIITDGRPTDTDKVRKLLIETANSLKDPSLLNITFIEIGTPEKYLKEFDNDLVSQGAKADIVSLYPFEQVNKKGMLKILAKQVSPKESIVKVKTNQLSETQIKLQAAIKAAEEKRRAEEAKSKILQEAANKRYDFSKPNSPNTISSPRPVSLKAHPTGTLRNPTITEINERESVLKEGANKTYSLPGKGTR